MPTANTTPSQPYSNLYKSSEIQIPAAWVPGGDIVLAYPEGVTRQSVLITKRHILYLNDSQELYSPDDILIVYGNTDITVTNNTTTTFQVGIKARLMIDVTPYAQSAALDSKNAKRGVDLQNVALLQSRAFDLGQPVAASANGIAEAQITVAGEGIPVTQNLPAGEGYRLDVARVLQFVSDNAGDDSTLSIRIIGKDTIGVDAELVLPFDGVTPVVTEKAFSVVKNLDAIDSAAYQAGGTIIPVVTAGIVSVGWEYSLGLLQAIHNTARQVVQAVERATTTDAVVKDFTTLNSRVTVSSDDQTLDQRGLYAPAATPDGVAVYWLEVKVADPVDGGIYKPTNQSR